MFKPLIAVTCLAALATVAYLGWGEFNRVQAAGKVAAYQEARGACLRMLDMYLSGTPSQQKTWWARVDDECVKTTLISSADIEVARRR